MAKIARPYTLLLRILAMAAAISAAVVMATGRQTTTFFNLTLKAEFSQTPSFIFFVIAYAIASLYSLLALFIQPTSLFSRWVGVFDVIISMLMTAAMGAAVAIAQVGKKGNKHAGWLPICEEVSKYCNQIMGALISGTVGLLLHNIIVFHTIITRSILFFHENN
ncbi:hypothetical protein KSP39_PZI024211 [Platanthera zijinensis]|uniref:CASP-like protein n=1 Tax=Platanthera zijinensis TaxID=2320716 RepID=A0AAP0FTJ8_9ASPA